MAKKNHPKNLQIKESPSLRNNYYVKWRVSNLAEVQKGLFMHTNCWSDISDAHSMMS